MKFTRDGARTHRFTYVLVGVATSAVLSGCMGGSGSLPENIGQLRPDGQGISITVPALWAGKDSNGNMVGGVEPAEIFVSTSGGTSEYELDLATLEAEGAGPSWRAATGMASAFSTIFVGADPANVSYSFKVSAPIDGPSAGGILSVGIIAAFRGESLAPEATMTGTITPDGTIGPVGGVLTKIESAAREGFTTIVLPRSLDLDGWENGNEYTELAEKLNVTLVPVDTVGDAYSAMTGNAVEPADLLPGPEFDPQVQAATRAVTESLMKSLEQNIAAPDQMINQEILDFAQDSLDSAQAEFASGNYARAYGVSALGLTRLTRASGGATIEEIVQTQGIEQAKVEVEKRASALLIRTQKNLLSDSQTRVQGLEQYFALPTSLGWATFAEATVEGILRELPITESPDALVAMGRTIAESDLGVTTFLPHSITVLQSVPTEPSVNEGEIAQQLSDYSRFLVRASEDTETYLAEVLRTELRDDGEFANNGYAAAAVAAREMSSRITSETEDFPQESIQLASALTYFWLVSYSAASIQAYQSESARDADDVNAARQESMDAAIDDSWWFLKTRAGILQQSGLDTSAAVWSGRWALEQSLASRGTPVATEAGWLAQGELWFDAIQVTMIGSYVQPTLIEVSE